MKLSYRGVSYDYNSHQVAKSTAPAPAVNSTLIYRGATYRVNQATQAETLETILKQRKAPASTTTLIYRGATYRLNQNANTDALGAVVKQREAIATVSTPTTPSATAQPSQNNIRCLNMAHYRDNKRRHDILLQRSTQQLSYNH
jgi:type IV secretory pathway VirB3-like protein